MLLTTTGAPGISCLAIGGHDPAGSPAMLGKNPGLSARSTAAPGRRTPGKDPPVEFSNCAGFTPDFSVDKITVSPDPVKAGQQFTFLITGQANHTLTQGANLRISVTLGKIPVWTDTVDLCASSAAAGMPCPIAPGRHALTIPVTLTDLPPFVDAEVRIETTNGDGPPLFCVTGTLTAVPG